MPTNLKIRKPVISCLVKRTLLQLLEDNPEIDYGDMGFPQNWRLEPLWHVHWQWLTPDEADMSEIEAGWLPLTSLFYAD